MIPYVITIWTHRRENIPQFQSSHLLMMQEITGTGGLRVANPNQDVEPGEQDCDGPSFLPLRCAMALYFFAMSSCLGVFVVAACDGAMSLRLCASASLRKFLALSPCLTGSP